MTCIIVGLDDGMEVHDTLSLVNLVARSMVYLISEMYTLGRGIWKSKSQEAEMSFIEHISVIFTTSYD